MSILFASNDPSDFVGGLSNTTAANRRTAYVSEAFSITGGDNPTRVCFVPHPKAAGNVQWVHFVYRKTTAWNSGGNKVALCTMYDDAGDRLFIVDTSGGAGERAQLNVLGDTTVVSDLTDIGTTLVAIDIKIDITTNLEVSIFVNGVLEATGAPANTGGKGLPIATLFHISNDGGNTAYLSEFITADEDTRNMGVSQVDPTAAGNYSQWTGDHDETGDSDLGTGASTDATGQKLSSDMTAFAGPTSAAFRALVVNNKCSTRGGVVGDLRNFLRISATDYNGAALGVNESIQNLVTVFNTNPDTTDHWDTADINGVEVGIESLA